MLTVQQMPSKTVDVKFDYNNEIQPQLQCRYFINSIKPLSVW